LVIVTTSTGPATPDQDSKPTYNPHAAYGKPSSLRTLIGTHTDDDVNEYKDHGVRLGVTTAIIAATAATGVGAPIAAALIGYNGVRAVQVHRASDRIRAKHRQVLREQNA
jgi:hypothetical protein